MNIPNKITLSRLWFTIIFIASSAVPPSNKYHLVFWRIGFVCMIIAAVSDWVDGFVARKYQQVTAFGKLFDPMADKIYVLAWFVILTNYRMIPAFTTFIVISRELAVSSLRGYVASKGIIVAANTGGKVKTTIQMITVIIGGMFWTNLISIDHPILYGYIWPFLLTLTIIFTIQSGFVYFKNTQHVWAKSM
eukprot:TRINITY_DN716_c0_g1_i1.p1 TRINITY_DN716_c0_g1~~TRINITY_DN716_c0_g1_i1.p1  ORF type:complete len:191 (-),score=33.23 TRINITY_DN716_c0_g1_i1:31-603(-)